MSDVVEQAERDRARAMLRDLGEAAERRAFFYRRLRARGLGRVLAAVLTVSMFHEHTVYVEGDDDGDV